MNSPLPKDIEQIALDSIGLNNPHPTDQIANAESADAQEDDALFIGRTIGGCQIVSRIGPWALGSLYQAVRGEDEPRVVVKITRRAISGELESRLPRAALRIQARLGYHPHVISLLDAGLTDDARLYFITEYVDDQPIDEYCDLRRLGVAERLKLLISACEAVHFNHQHGAIHGDLKPTNILVSAKGVPRLTDFGVANLVAEWLGVPTDPSPRDPTLAELRPEALDCLSPEQVEGNAITTSSDVYALGMVLYRLLAGCWPYRPKTRTTADLLKAISEQTVEPPSKAVFRQDVDAEKQTVAASSDPASDEPGKPIPADRIAAARSTSPKCLSRTLAGDLDAIVAKALAKSPANRYSSAEQLAQDLRRWIAGSPVHARSDSTVYRLITFAGRRTTLVVSAVIVTLALVMGGLATTIGLVLSRRDRDQDSSADARYVVNHLFIHMSQEHLLNEPGFESLRETFFQDARSFYQGFLDKHGEDPSLKAERAVVHGRLGEIAQRIGPLDQALVHYHTAIALGEDLIARSPNNRGAREQLANALHGMGRTLLQRTSRLDEALAAFHRAQDLDQALLSDDPKSIPLQKQLGDTLLNLALLESRKGRADKAIHLLESVLDIETRLANENPTDLDPPLMLASAHAAMGRINAGEPDQHDKATLAYQTAIDLLTPISQTHPELADESQLLAIDLGDLGQLQQSSGLQDAALLSFERARNLLERLIQAHPSVPAYQDGLAANYNILCDFTRRRGETTEALGYARKAIPLLEKLVADNPENSNYRLSLAKSYNYLGRLLQLTGEPTAALRSFQRSVDLHESLSTLEPPERYNLARSVALCIPLMDMAKTMAKDKRSPDAGSLTRRRLYGDRAMAALKQANRSGFLKAEMIQNDPDLDSLRDRDDFQALIKEIEDAPLKSPP